MRRTQREIDQDHEEDIYNQLRTMLDKGLEKNSSDQLIKMIKELAVIAVRQRWDK